MAKEHNEAFFWSLFSIGGMVAALLIPAYLFVFFLAAPLGLMPAPSYDRLVGLLQSPFVRLGLFVMCAFPLFHWAHRFRYTLYDGLQVKHLNEVIFALCYGGATVGTVVAAVLLWSRP
jgi:fumarate reductase subunit D